MASAFAALVSLQNNLRLICNHPTHSSSFERKQMQSLRDNVISMIDFMKSYDNAHGARKQDAAALYMRIVRAAEAAEDVVETHVVDQIRYGKTRKSKTRSSRYLLDLQKVIEDMKYMRRKAMNVKAQSGSVAEQQPTYSAAPLTSNKTARSTMVGFDGFLLELLDLLTGVPSSLQVIPIVGMGGIGKTTLVKNAFEHPLIVHRFDICLWATISQQYRVENILIQLLSGLRKYVSQTVDESSSSRTVSEELYKSMYGRRYLIILDDIWSVEPWDEMKFLFPDTGNGCRIVVTSRDSYVANHLAVNATGLEMNCLDEERSWDLFCQKAFTEQDCSRELEEIGRKIVEKCRELPLAIVVADGHLRNSEMSREYWGNVACDMNSILNSTDKEEQCMSVLSLSYSYLHVHLKPCFLLLGAFPEDESIDVRDAYNLWIYEGIIESFVNTSLEVVAKGYIHDLFVRDLILGDVVGPNREMIRIKLHDLVRQMCQKIAKNEELLYVIDTPQAVNRRAVL